MPFRIKSSEIKSLDVAIPSIFKLSSCPIEIVLDTLVMVVESIPR